MVLATKEDKQALLSLVIPAYKQEKTIDRNIDTIENALSPLPYRHEIIVVVDGFVDKTYENAKRVKNASLKVLGYKENKGKGFAVKYGIQKASGDIIGFIDSGFDINPGDITILLDYMKLHDADIVVGSKTHPDSEVDYPLYRTIISFGARLITKILFGFSVQDTQVGLKIFKRKVAKDVFPRLLVKKFAFDIEMLAVANVLGYHKIYEAPVKLRFEVGSISLTRLFSILLKTLWDTLAIFYRIKVLKYYRKSNRANWLKP